MDRLRRLQTQLTATNSACPYAGIVEPRGYPPTAVGIKPKKYHHVKDPKIIAAALRDNKRLSSMLPRFRVPEDQYEKLPEEIKDVIENGKMWAVFQDGAQHKLLRQSFPHHFMVYDLTRKYNLEWMREYMAQLVHDVVLSSAGPAGAREIDIKRQIAKPASQELLCRVFGLKQANKKLRGLLSDFADHSGDTGGRYTVVENMDVYKHGLKVVGEFIDEIDVLLKSGATTSPKYDLENGLIARLVREKRMDKKWMRNQCMMWILGGTHNPANLISLTMGIILQHPDQIKKLRRLVREKPEDAPLYVHRVSSEVLRILPPAQVVVRIAEEDLTLGKKFIKKGDGVILHLELGNHSKHLGGTEFDALRVQGNNHNGKYKFDQRKHFAFGVGPHRCLGGETGQLLTEVFLENIFLADILPRPPSAPPLLHDPTKVNLLVLLELLLFKK